MQKILASGGLAVVLIAGAALLFAQQTPQISAPPEPAPGYAQYPETPAASGETYGPAYGETYGQTNPYTESAGGDPYGQLPGASTRVQEMIRLSTELGQILETNELQAEIARLQERIGQRRAELRLQAAIAELTAIVNEYPDSAAAGTATRMLRQSATGSAAAGEDAAVE